MIQAADLIAVFEQMYREHWPYEWGAARKGCVDCSGAFVYAYKQFGQSIAHGSNNIARNYVRSLLSIEHAEPGMAAFKVRKPGQSGYDLPARYADSSDKRDFYHIGLVDSTGRYVLNAKSTKAGFTRDPIEKWHAVGRLKAVEYGSVIPMEKQTMIVTCTPGEKVRLRAVPSTSGSTLTQIPNGTTVLAGENEDGWRTVEYNGKSGYMMAEFLKAPVADSKPQDSADTDTENPPVAIYLPYRLAYELRDILINAIGNG